MREPRTRHSTSLRRMFTGWNDTTDGIATEAPKHGEEVWLINKMPPPPPGWFLAKSAESLENKGVEFFVVQKSAEESEKTEVRWKSSVFCRELTGCRQTVTGFGGTAWWATIACGAQKESRRFYTSIITYWYSMSRITLSALDGAG